MPKLKIARVVSFSNEDPAHPASNILLDDPNKKWKCKTPGEKSAIIVLELEQPSVISSIDIGNENSAYIEVLVNRSGSDAEFKPLLVMSSFMTPLEARQTQNINKVRMFTTEQLSKPECEQKWDRIKIVCTQPFNRHAQYGLSFVNFYTPEDKNGGNGNDNKIHTIGKFIVRPDSPDTLGVGSLFARRKELQENEPLKGAAAIRAASPNTLKCKAQLSSGLTPKNDDKTPISTDVKPPARNRNELLYNKDDDAPHEKIDKVVEKNRQAKAEKEEKEEKAETKKRKKETPKKEKEKTARPSTSKEPESKKRKTVTKVKKTITKPFSELLKGVVFVVSGIQNPERYHLRKKALELGAKYKPDWDNSCTHLICAFTNTPKFKQVKGKGKIVKKEWMDECYNQRKRLPWRRYALDPKDKGEESEEEICEEVKQKEENRPIEESKRKETVKQKEESDATDDEAEGFDDSLMEKRIAELEKQGKKLKNGRNDHRFSQETDEEFENKPPSSALSPPKLFSDFFQNKTFYLDQNLPENVQQNLVKYITAYDGKLSDDLCANLDYVIGDAKNVSVIKEINTDATCLPPDWVWECHEKQKLVDTNDFKL